MLRAYILLHLTVRVLSSTFDEFCDVGPKSTACIRRKSGCKPSWTTCKKVDAFEMVDADRWKVLKAHNDLRQKQARGEVESNPLKSSDMNLVGYSLEIEFLIQCLLNTCELEHDEAEDRDSPNYQNQGQNLNAATYVTESTFDLENPIKQWFGEVKRYTGGSKFVLNRNTAHYTQLVWSQVKLIGCGKIFHSGGHVFFGCNYYPGRNGSDEILFKEGEPCTACSDGAKCNPVYPALCGPTPDFPVDPTFVPRGGGLSSKTSITRSNKRAIMLSIMLIIVIIFKWSK